MLRENLHISWPQSDYLQIDTWLEFLLIIPKVRHFARAEFSCSTSRSEYVWNLDNRIWSVYLDAKTKQMVYCHAGPWPESKDVRGELWELYSHGDCGIEKEIVQGLLHAERQWRSLDHTWNEWTGFPSWILGFWRDVWERKYCRNLNLIILVYVKPKGV